MTGLERPPAMLPAASPVRTARQHIGSTFTGHASQVIVDKEADQHQVAVSPVQTFQSSVHAAVPMLHMHDKHI